ncbi:MAG: hypothetical protein KY475_05630 [Planctomycetes bacterium]|nr:hypothetical protein [Planctomycetota bacterium]
MPAAPRKPYAEPYSLVAAILRGAWFGARFTFWLLVALVTAPMAAYVVLNLAARPSAIWQIFSIGFFVRIVIPAVVVPLAGAALGGMVAGILLPLASLLNGRSEKRREQDADEPPSPFDDPSPAPRSREELLRRIVGGPQEPCEST